VTLLKAETVLKVRFELAAMEGSDKVKLNQANAARLVASLIRSEEKNFWPQRGGMPRRPRNSSARRNRGGPGKQTPQRTYTSVRTGGEGTESAVGRRQSDPTPNPIGGPEELTWCFIEGLTSSDELSGAEKKTQTDR